MGFKEQLDTLKRNWLLIILGLVVLVLLSGGEGIISQSFDSVKSLGGIYEMGYGGGSEMDNYYPGSRTSNGNFAPETTERKITKNSRLSTEIERGEFKEAEVKLKNIVSSSGAYLLNERVSRNGEGWRGYYYGSYSLKVDTERYEAVVSQLKEIGKVQDFNEDMADVTGRYEDLNLEISIEKQRLERYMEMFEEASGELEYKIDLNDRIFDQERRIKYLENSLRNIDNRIDYSNINFTMTEERSDWANIALVKLSSLIRGFVESLNALLGVLFEVLPWVVVGLFGWVVWKRFRK